MSFSKSKTGTADEIVKLLQLVPDEVAADDDNDSTATPATKKAHRLQAENAVNAVEHILQRIPEEHNARDKETGESLVTVAVSIYGSASSAGGSFGGSYAFAKKA